MSFDPRSLERLRELGRQMPEKLDEPKAIEKEQLKPSSKQHRIETEQNPQVLFRELMKVSQDGTVPEHLLKRLRDAESNNLRLQSTTHQNPIENHPYSSLQESSFRSTGMKNKEKTFKKSKHLQSSPRNDEEKQLYADFGQLLLEEE